MRFPDIPTRGVKAHHGHVKHILLPISPCTHCTHTHTHAYTHTRQETQPCNTQKLTTPQPPSPLPPSHPRPQDILRLLTLWFNHGHYADVERELTAGFGLVSIDTWLSVIPQIIARIHTNNATVRGLIHTLLVTIGRHHPQVGVGGGGNATGERRKAPSADCEGEGRDTHWNSSGPGKAFVLFCPGG